MVFPENSTGPPSILVCGSIVHTKSERLQTSMYPPILSTLKFVPVSEFLVTDIGAVTSEPDVGFLYSKLIFFFCFHFSNFILMYHPYNIEEGFQSMV
jgi:hypothetical protein